MKKVIHARYQNFPHITSSIIYLSPITYKYQILRWDTTASAVCRMTHTWLSQSGKCAVRDKPIRTDFVMSSLLSARLRLTKELCGLGFSFWYVVTSLLFCWRFDSVSNLIDLLFSTVETHTSAGWSGFYFNTWIQIRVGGCNTWF